MNCTVKKMVTCVVFFIGCVVGILGHRDLFIDYMLIGLAIDCMRRME